MTAPSELFSPQAPGRGDSGPVTLEQVLGDLDAFQSRIQHQQPYVQDLAGIPLGRLLSLDDVDLLLTGSGLRRPFVSLVENDRIISEDHYCRRIRIGAVTVPDFVHSGKVIDHVRSGATMILQGLQRYWPPVARLCREAEARWGYACHANAYLTPANAQGFAEHEDGHDTLLIQTYGAKKWTVGQQPVGALSDLREDGGRWTFTLAAPAALYIPAGTLHAGATAGEPSLHVTIGMTPWTWERAARQIIDLALGSLDLSGRLPAGALTGRVDLDQQMSELAQRLADAIGGLSSDAVVASLAAGFIDKAPPLLSGQLRHALASPTISDASLVARRPGALAAVIESDGEAVLVLGDRHVPFPAARVAALRHVLDLAWFRVSELDPFLVALDRIKLVEDLVREGLLVVLEE